MDIKNVTNVVKNVGEAICYFVISLRENWIETLSQSVFTMAWFCYCAHDRFKHVGFIGFILGMVGCYILGSICQYCCKRLKQTLMLMGVVVLVLLSILLVKMILS